MTTAETPEFVAARPVWPAGREREMNLLAGFRAAVARPAAGARVVLRLTASTMYRVFVNGTFVGYGPARSAHGWFRVDEWDMSGRLTDGANIVAIEVTAYNAPNYSAADNPAFLQAELTAGRAVLAATGDRRFAGAVLAHRIQRVPRYSSQRAFSEVWDLSGAPDDWRTGADFAAAPLAAQPAVRLLPRRVPYPSFACVEPEQVLKVGSAAVGALPDPPWRPQFVTRTDPTFRCFPLDACDANPLDLAQSLVTRWHGPGGEQGGPIRLPAAAAVLLDFGVNLSGFIGIEIRCVRAARLLLLFDEFLVDGDDVDIARLNCLNAIELRLPAGLTRFESIEPYTLRYLKLVVLDGDGDVNRVYLREYANPAATARLACADTRLLQIFEAGRQSFRQNAPDLFMDCPSRERAGWLCDSYWTARGALALCGNLAVEHAFLENYLLAPEGEPLPPGMWPMCYPADHPGGRFIPNWALWGVLQLAEFRARGGDPGLVEAFRPKVERLFGYFDAFRNELGLLEKLESWVFIEWSKANAFVQDVNFPSNMLYAAALDAAGRLYGRDDWPARAEELRETIRALAFDGTFFVDNAVREDGNLRVTSNRTETCQYYAFYFDVATPETHAELWRVVRDELGPRRAAGRHEDIQPSNMFVGVALRLELLARHGAAAQMLEEVIDYHLAMAQRTGTLWENLDDGASCNHGFTSHVCALLRRHAGA